MPYLFIPDYLRAGVNPITKYEPPADPSIDGLEAEVTQLERDIHHTEQELNSFEAIIRSKLHQQIIRIRELTAVYKEQKAAKKAKRLEQKKRGKNYKEPKGLRKTRPARTKHSSDSGDDQHELKRLYKEAIVRIHPDKFATDEASQQRATEITTQLNAIYQEGDLEGMSVLHEHIISGNAMTYKSLSTPQIHDRVKLRAFLEKKKAELILAMEEMKNSSLYDALTRENPDVFINELKIQFDERIRVLEKRTRKGK